MKLYRSVMFSLGIASAGIGLHAAEQSLEHAAATLYESPTDSLEAVSDQELAYMYGGVAVSAFVIGGAVVSFSLRNPEEDQVA